MAFHATQKHQSLRSEHPMHSHSLASLDVHRLQQVKISAKAKHAGLEETAFCLAMEDHLNPCFASFHD